MGASFSESAARTKVKPGLKSQSKRLSLALFSFSMLAPLRFEIYIDPTRSLPLLELSPLVALFTLWLSFLLLPRQTSRRVYAALCWTPLLILFLAMTWSYQFYHLFGGDPISGVLAQRWQFYWLLLPIGLAMNENGISTKAIFAAIVFPVAFVLIFFIVRQITWDLPALASNPITRLNIRIDELRGYRLIYPQYAIFAAIFFASAASVWRNGSRWISVIFLIALILIYLPVFSRLHLIYSVIVFLVFFLCVGSRGQKTTILRVAMFIITMTSIVVAALPSLVRLVGDDTLSGQTRLGMLPVLMDLVNKYPILGSGVGSTQDVSLRVIYGSMFAPTDWGLLGIIATQGLVGALIVIFILIFMLRSTYLAVESAGPSERYLAIGALFVAIFFFVGSATFPPLLGQDGTLVGVLTILISKLLLRDRNLQLEPTGHRQARQWQFVAKEQAGTGKATAGRKRHV